MVPKVAQDQSKNIPKKIFKKLPEKIGNNFAPKKNKKNVEKINAFFGETKN